MANNVVGSLLVNLGLSTARLKSDTDKAERHFKDFDRKASRSLGSIRNGVTGLVGSMGALTGVMGVLTVGGLGALISRSLSAADEIQKLNLRLGASTESLSEYRHVMELSGVEFKSFTKGLQNMVDKVSDASQGTGEAAASLRQLNLDATALNRLKPEDQLEAIADAMMGIQVEGDRTRIAMDLFGGRGVQLLQAMRGGAAGIRELRDEAKELGLSLSIDQVNAAADAKDAMTRLKASFEALTTTAAINLAPTLTSIADQFSAAIPASIKIATRAIDSFWLAFAPEKASPVGQMRQLSEEIQATTREIIRMRTMQTEGGLDSDLWGIGKIIKQDEDKLAELQTRYQRLADQYAAKPLVVPISNTPPPTNVGPAIDVDQEKENARLQVKLDTLTTSLMDEEQRLFESNERRSLIINDAFERELITKERQRELLLAQAKDFEKQQTEILIKAGNERLAFERLTMRQKSQTVIGEMIALTQGVAQHSRKMFEINKAAGIANALVNTYQGVTKSLATYPWPLAGIMAGLHLASGLAQVSAIKSTSFGGGGGAPSLAATGGTPANPVIQDNLETQSTQQQGSQITIHIDGNVYANDDFRLAIVDAIGQATSNDEIRIVSNGN